MVFVVLGSLLNEWFSQKGLIPKEFTGFFSQQWSSWTCRDSSRSCSPRVCSSGLSSSGVPSPLRLKGLKKTSLPWLFLFSGLAIPMFYAVGLLAGQRTHVTVAEFWRFWVVHLWVEDFLELFTTVMVAYIFVLLGVVRERIAISIIMMGRCALPVGGVIGTLHHTYFVGTPPSRWHSVRSSPAAEVIPLTFPDR